MLLPAIAEAAFWWSRSISCANWTSGAASARLFIAWGSTSSRRSCHVYPYRTAFDSLNLAARGREIGGVSSTPRARRSTWSSVSPWVSAARARPQGHLADARLIRASIVTKLQFPGPPRGLVDVLAARLRTVAYIFVLRHIQITGSGSSSWAMPESWPPRFHRHLRPPAHRAAVRRNRTTESTRAGSPNRHPPSVGVFMVYGL